jgi:hypothetical protein
MSLKSRLRQAAISDHQDCDGRFCELKEHPEMEAIERLAELEAEVIRVAEDGGKAWAENVALKQERDRLRELLPLIDAVTEERFFVIKQGDGLFSIPVDLINALMDKALEVKDEE